MGQQKRSILKRGLDFRKLHGTRTALGEAVRLMKQSLSLSNRVSRLLFKSVLTPNPFELAIKPYFYTTPMAAVENLFPEPPIRLQLLVGEYESLRAKLRLMESAQITSLDKLSGLKDNQCL